MEERAQRDRLERLQVEARALEVRLGELRPKLRPARKAADDAEHRHQTALSELWRRRTENARLEVETGLNRPLDGSAAPLLGLVLVVGALIALVVLVANL